MKNPPESPSVKVFRLEDLEHPQPAAAVATTCHTLAELVHSLGTRIKVAQQWGMGSRTLNIRMQDPGTCTVAELKKLAGMAKLNLLDVLKLTAYQVEHPDTAIPTVQRGAPPRTH